MPLIRILLAVCALAASGALWAQCGVTMTCTGTPPATPGLPGIDQSGVCRPSSCLSDAGKERYAREHDCKFPPGDLCGELAINKATQCCTKDAQSGKTKIRNKQITVLDGEFNWENYKKECTAMRQSTSPADGLWQQCTEGAAAPGDEYKVVEVIRNGTTRDQCVDGCSTPQSALPFIGVAPGGDKDNPSGYRDATGRKPASFFPGCRAHDICYQSCNGGSQASCDEKLKADNLAACDNIPADHKTFTGIHDGYGRPILTSTRNLCQTNAKRMATGLWAGGGPAFSKRRQQYCQCC